MSILTDALARLRQYNLSLYNAVTNPFGLTGVGAADINLEPMLGDVATAAEAAADAAESTSSSSTAAADSAASAATSASSASDSAGAALTKAGEAAESAAAASGSATAAAGSANAAALSATQADLYAAAAGGAVPAVRLNWDTTTTDADPGNGRVRLNNATLASATYLYIDNLDAAGTNIAAVIDRWGAGTNAVRGVLRIAHRTDLTKWLEFDVTGAPVDGTGYRKVPIANGTGPGGFVSMDVVAVGFSRAGNAGAAGADGLMSPASTAETAAGTSTTKGVTPAGLAAYVPALPELTSGQVDTSADLIEVYDASAAALKKVKLVNLGISAGISAIPTVTATASTTFDLQNKPTVLVPLTHGANITTLTISNVPTVCEMIIVRTKDGSSTARSITWGSAFKGSVKLRQAPSVTDVIRWISSDAGASWYPSGIANTLTVARDNLVAYWVANRYDSYRADGLWHNVEPSPVDSTGQTAYDLYLGAGSGAESSDPTFNGAIDNASVAEYFSCDGGDYFSLAGSNTTFLNSLHKSGATGTIMLLVDVASVAAYSVLFATFSGAAAQQGIYFAVDNTGKLELGVGKGSAGYALSKFSDSPITTGLHCIGLSWTEGSTGFFYTDNGYKQSGAANTWSATYATPSSAAASQPLTLLAYGGGGTPVPNGTKIRGVVLKNTALSLAQMQVLETQLRADCGY